MKTPWRFLAGLVSRKLPITRDKDTSPTYLRALEYKPAEYEVDTSSADEAPSPEIDKSVEELLGEKPSLVVPENPGTIASSDLQMDELQSSAAYVDEIVELDVSQREDEISAPSGIRQRNEHRKAQPGHVKRVRAKPSAPLQQTASSRTEQLEAITAEESGYNDMMKLDIEIQRLRSDLAPKLAAQNDLLRRMLRRYEGN